MLINIISYILAVAEPLISNKQALTTFLFAAPLLAAAIIILSVGFDTRRYLALAPSLAWLSGNYICNLPNMLKEVYDKALVSPWPSRPTAVHAAIFKRRMRKALGAHFKESRHLIDQHLSLWVFIELHRQDLRELVLRNKIARLRKLLINTPNDILRQRLLRQISRCREQLTLLVQIMPMMPAKRADSAMWLVRLKALSAMFAEHGYQIDPALTELEHWQFTKDEELLAEVATGDEAVAML